MKFLTIFLTILLVLSIAPAAVEATLVVNKYTNDFTLASPNNEQLKVCACGLKTDTLLIENVGNFYASYTVEIISPVGDWMTLSEESFSLAPKHGKELLVFVKTPCGSVGTYDYVVRVTSSYGREEILQRTIRADQCQNIVLNVIPEKTVNNLCQPADYNVSIKNVGTYGETYQLSFGTYDQYMNVSLREFYLKPGQELKQTSTLVLPCTFYGEYNIPFLVYTDKNRLEKEQKVPLLVENQFDHSIALVTQENVCSRVAQDIPITITNEIDVANEYSIILKGPNFVDIENNERTIALDGYENKTLLLEVAPEEGQEGIYTLSVEVTDKFGKIKKAREVELNVQNCYDFEIEVRGELEPVTEQTLCCGSYEYFLNVRNNGQTTETYNIDPLGPSWFQTEEITVRLDPGENKNVRLYADVPCADNEYVIPILVMNNRYNEVNETVYFTINAETERTCHAIAIDDDEFVITKEATIIPVIVKHTGTEGGVYDVTLDSELFTPVETQMTLNPGETGVLHLEAKNLSPFDFGRYINIPTLTYTTQENPLAYVTEDIDYNEHVGTQLRDKSIFAKAVAWIKDNIGKPGVCGWITIILLIAALALLAFLLTGGRIEAEESTLQLLRFLFIIGIVVVFILLAIIKMPDPAEMYELPDNPENYFITIYENGRETTNLDQYFTDADNDVLSYVASQPKDISARIDENTLTLKPDLGFTGENNIVITANDGFGGYKDSPVLKIYVLPAKELSFLGLWHRYCTQLNLALVLLILLLMLIFTHLAKETKPRKTPLRKALQVVENTIKKSAKVMRKASKKAARKVVRKTAARKTPKKAVRKMTAAQKIAHKKLMDRTLVSNESHEMRQVLATHGKRGTAKNVKILQGALKRFKADKKYKNNRKAFYQYLKDKKVLFRLENIKKAVVVRKTPKKAVRKMTAAQKATLSKAMDHALVSNEPHEMRQVLSRHGKRGTQKNVTILQGALKRFKADKKYKNNRVAFYNYLKDNRVLARLESKKRKVTIARKTPKKVARKAPKKRMSAAQKAKISRTLDHNLVSSEDHEMKQILATFKKRQTKENVETLRAALKSFKGDARYKPKNRKKFYQYLESMNVFTKLSGKGLTKAQRAAISRALDQTLVSQQPHELKQVLSTHGKKSTAHNVKVLGAALADFRKGRYTPKNRVTFYRYLKEQGVLRRLHNK